jgi:putative phosphoesterase
MYIGLLSDTHSHLDPTLFDHFADCDELWHAGDVGAVSVLDRLAEFKPVRGVYGNIDDQSVRSRLPLDQRFSVGGLSVFMTHIGGYPGHYTSRVRQILDVLRPDLYICGHSHILKVVPDKKRGCLHLNPGASGRHGFHRMRTALRFRIDAGKIKQLEVLELGLRGAID